MAGVPIGQGPYDGWLSWPLLTAAGAVFFSMAGLWNWRESLRRAFGGGTPAPPPNGGHARADDDRIRRGALEVLHDIATGMLEGAGFDVIGARAARDLSGVLGGVRVTVWLLEDDENLRLVASSGSLPPGVHRKEQRGFELREGEVRRWEDIAAQSRLTREDSWWDQSRSRALLEVPLPGTASVLGTLAFDSPEPRTWTDAEVHAGERVAAYLATALEVSQFEEERRVAVEKLRQSEVCFRALFEHGPFPQFIVDRSSSRILMVNGAALETYGWSREEFSRLTLDDITPPEGRESLRETLEAVRRTPARTSWNVDTVHQTRDARSLRVRVLIRDASFVRPDAVLVVVQEAVTPPEAPPRARAEMTPSLCPILELAVRGLAREMPPREVLASLCRTVERMFPGRLCTVYAFDEAAGVIRLVWGDSLSPGAREAAGVLPVRPDLGVCPVAVYRRERVVCPDMLTDPNCRPFLDVIRQEGLRSCLSQPMTDAAGRVLGTFAFYGREAGDPGAEVVRILASVAQLAGLVLEHDRIMTAARRTEERLELALLATQDGVWERHAANGRVWLSPRCRELLGLDASQSEIGFEQCVEMMHPEDRESAVFFSRRALEAGRRYDAEYRMLVRGEYRWFRSRAVPRMEGGRVVGLVGSLADITDQRRAELTLRALMEGTARTTGDAFFTTLVRQLATSLGLRWALVGGVTKDEPRVVRALAAWDGDGPTEPLEYLLAGTPCESVVVGPAETFFIPADAQAKFPRSETMRRLGVQGCAGAVIRDSTGEAIGVLGVLHDATIERAEEEVVPLLRVFAARAGAEMERLRHEETLAVQGEQLRQAQRLEAVGRLASGVAHDFNNLLTAIRGYTSLASATLPAEHAARVSLAQVEEAARQASSVASSLLTFARKTAPVKQIIPVARSVETACRLFQRMVPPSVRVAVDVEGGRGLMVEADDTQVQQVVMNLCLNARDAVGSSGLVEVKVRRGVGDGGREEAWISVRDDGVGMPPEVRSRVFEPFFTTKKPGEGTGLGLSVAHGIVREHGGRIVVESFPGRGSVFTVALPTTTAPEPQRLPSRAPVHDVPRGDGAAMVVEPNPMVRGVIASMLEALGYQVRGFESLDEAMREWGAGSADVIVGERRHAGEAWEAFVRTLAPAARVAICGRDEDAQEAAQRGLAVLRKPFQLGDLEAAIASARVSRTVGS